MKIGILTYHRAMNYGAVLQAYALKTFLSNLWHKTTIIDYFPDHHTGMYYFTIKTFFRLLAKFRFKKILYIFYFRYSKRYKKFLSFLKEKLDLINKPEYCVPSDILDVHDVYIYGSDQVWRNAHSKTYLWLHLWFEDIYFGNFPRGMKKR